MDLPRVHPVDGDRRAAGDETDRDAGQRSGAARERAPPFRATGVTPGLPATTAARRTVHTVFWAKTQGTVGTKRRTHGAGRGPMEPSG
jgi:hypothetical protein